MKFMKYENGYFYEMRRCEQRNPHHRVSGHHTTVWEHTQLVENAVEKLLSADSEGGKLLRYVALLHDTGKPVVKTWDEAKSCDRFLKHADESVRIAEELLAEEAELTEEEKEMVIRLIETHESVGGMKAIRRYRNKYGDFMTRLHLTFRFCDVAGQNPALASDKLAELDAAWECYWQLAEEDL